MTPLAIEPDWPAPTHIKAYTTLRSSWGNQDATTHPAGSFKNPESTRRLIQLLNLPSPPCWITQKHTTLIVEADIFPEERVADASFTSVPGKVCAVLTADCLPVFFCDKAGSRVAAVHAGWRGLAGGILEKTLDTLNIAAEELLVWLGPAIGPQWFEVGIDVYEAFTHQHPESASAFTTLSTDKWLADLYQLARIRLAKRGIMQSYGGNFCTYSQEDLFFSYRRDHQQTGRMVSVIWINEK